MRAILVLPRMGCCKGDGVFHFFFSFTSKPLVYLSYRSNRNCRLLVSLINPIESKTNFVKAGKKAVRLFLEKIIRTLHVSDVSCIHAVVL
jgi:hypothetical protein